MESRLMKIFVFFFSSRRRHTRLQGDWSSDVCSSDLVGAVATGADQGVEALQQFRIVEQQGVQVEELADLMHQRAMQAEIGRASCREREETAEGAEAEETK